MGSNDAVLILEPGVAKLLEERGIRDEDLRTLLHAVEQGHGVHRNRLSGRELAYRSAGNVTFWVEYRREEGGYRIFNAYSHRMKLLEGYNLASSKPPAPSEWDCTVCDAPLELATVKLKYLDETFAADLHACPTCQRVLITEEQAVVKMALAERMLEDK